MKADKKQYNMTKARVKEENFLEIQSSIETISAWGSQGCKRESRLYQQIKKYIHGWPGVLKGHGIF